MASSSVSFDRAAAYYDDTRTLPPAVGPRIGALLAAAGRLTPTSRVIEPGIGTGRIALLLARQVGLVCGVDISRPMMQRLLAKRDGAPVFPVEGDATRLPYQTGTFDAAVLAHVMHLIPGWRDALSELARVLKPGGVLLHTWSDRSEEMKPMMDALDEAIPWTRRQHVGVQWAERDTFLADAGWQPVGQMSLDYESTFSAQQFIAQVQGRMWSNLWRVTDAEIDGAIPILQETAAAHFDDPARPVVHQNQFYVSAYQPPS